MIRTLVWKEYREQRAVLMALAVLSVVLIAGLVLFAIPPGAAPFTPFGSPSDGFFLLSPRAGITLMTAVIMAGTYGVMCGSLMLAGEREARTLAFLDALARQRTSLWISKVQVGGLLTLGHAFLLAGIVLVTGFRDTGAPPLVLAVILTLVVLTLIEWVAFTCGLFFSALCHSVLAAVALSGFVLVASVYLTIALDWLTKVMALGLVLVLGFLGGTTLWGSWWIFCRLDRDRGTVVVPLGGFTPLLWLTIRQGKMVVLVLGAAGLGLACIPQFSMVWWPALTLLAGVLCGTGAFAAEQGSGAHRFLGDQRFPSGRVWAVKIGFWLVLAAWVPLLILLGESLSPRFAKEPGWVRNILIPENGRNRSVDYIGFGTYLTLWLVYGFSVGQFFALVVRKSLVALILSLLMSVGLLVLWLPSLVWGGVGGWQVFAVPVFLLAASRLELWAWFSGQLFGGKAALYLTGGGLLAGAWMAGNFAYRVLEVPDVGEPFDVSSYEAGMPTPEQNQAGLLILKASEELLAQEKRVTKDLGGPEDYVPWVNSNISEAFYHGWPEKDFQVIGPIENLKLSQWLDRLFEDHWAADLHKVSTLPLGVIGGPLEAGNRRYVLVVGCSDAGDLLAARALQLQARGDDHGALDHLTWALVLSRNMRNRATWAFGQDALLVQRRAFWAFDVWLRKLGPRPELLRLALEELTRHEALTPATDDYKKADYLFCLHVVEDQSIRQESLLPYITARQDPVGSLALALPAPWERARQIRILNILYQGEQKIGKDRWEHLSATPLMLWRWLASFDFDLFDLRILTSLRQVREERLKVALALYQVQEGKPAASLEDLLPRYLSEVLLDPIQGTPFHYRVSKGEPVPFGLEPGKSTPPGLGGHANDRMVPGEPNLHFVPAGQGIIWTGDSPGGDGTFLVPLWPKIK